jgi:hypothetical protein
LLGRCHFYLFQAFDISWPSTLWAMNIPAATQF